MSDMKEKNQQAVQEIARAIAQAHPEQQRAINNGKPVNAETAHQIAAEMARKADRKQTRG